MSFPVGLRASLGLLCKGSRVGAALGGASIVELGTDVATALWLGLMLVAALEGFTISLLDGKDVF